MCKDPFYCKDSSIRAALPCLLAVIDGEGGYVKANSMKEAAGKCVDQMHKPNILGRKPDQRVRKMVSTIELGIKLGYVTYNGAQGRLTLTDKGYSALNKRRERYTVQTA